MQYDDDDTGDLKADVGRRLRKLRHIFKLDQAEIGEIVGLGQSGYTRCETGERLIKPEHAIKLCERFHVSLDWIYRGDTVGLRRDMIDQLVAIRAAFAPTSPRRKTKTKSVS